jgi:hypothetical protein
MSVGKHCNRSCIVNCERGSNAVRATGENRKNAEQGLDAAQCVLIIVMHTIVPVPLF